MIYSGKYDAAMNRSKQINQYKVKINRPKVKFLLMLPTRRATRILRVFSLENMTRRWRWRPQLAGVSRAKIMRRNEGVGAR
jgi:hypothetical protein